MTDHLDDQFYNRADAHIHLSNEQAKMAGRAEASASTLYAAARFNAYVTAIGHASAQAFAADRQEAIDYFTRQYRLMLEDNLDDYIRNYEAYVIAPRQTKQETPE